MSHSSDSLPSSPASSSGGGLVLIAGAALALLAAVLLASSSKETPDTANVARGKAGAQAGAETHADSQLRAPSVALPETSASDADTKPDASRASAADPTHWTAGARDYELRYTDAGGQKIVRTIRFDPSGERLTGRVGDGDSWSYPLALPAAELEGQSAIARDLRILIDQVTRADATGKPLQRVGLPGGGWIEAKRQVEGLPATIQGGEACRGARTHADLRGVTRSGERFQGRLQADLWLAEQANALVALRVKQTLRFAEHGERTIAFSLRPLAPKAGTTGAKGERKVGWRQVPAGERRVAALDTGSAASELATELAPPLALLGSGVLLLLLLNALLRWLGPQSVLCLLLAFSLVATPIAVQAQDTTSFGDRFSDPTENEIAGTVLAGVAVGIGAAFAFFSAPVWVPVAVGVAGVSAIGAYWWTRTPPIRKGTISDKRFEPDRTYLTYTTTIVPDGKGGTTTVMVPQPVHDDADYIIYITAGDETSKVYVTAAQYEVLRVGQVFDMDTDGGNRFDEHDARRATAAERARLDAAKARGEESIDLEGINDALQGATRRD